MSLRFGLIGVFLAPEHVGYCFYHDADVEQESPVLNIPQVSSYPAFHLGKFFGFSPVAGDLRPSGNSGFDKVAHHVFVNQLGIFLCMFQHMGSGTYNGHLSFEYINELPFICKKQTYLNDQFIEETYSSLNGLRFKTISTGNVWFLTVRKDGEKIGFYKFTFVGEGPYNQKTDPECYFNIYTHDANLITDNPTEIFRQDFIQPQTPGEDYYKPSRSSYKHGTFDF